MVVPISLLLGLVALTSSLATIILYTLIITAIVDRKDKRARANKLKEERKAEDTPRLFRVD